jgi:hypothetical protein
MMMSYDESHYTPPALHLLMMSLLLHIQHTYKHEHNIYETHTHTHYIYIRIILYTHILQFHHRYIIDTHPLDQV